MARTRLHVFDLHCDTLDRLALHSIIPEAGYVYEDFLIPANRMVSLLDNDAHISLDRMVNYNWCQCFAALFRTDWVLRCPGRFSKQSGDF